MPGNAFHDLVGGTPSTGMRYATTTILLGMMFPQEVILGDAGDGIFTSPFQFTSTGRRPSRLIDVSLHP